MSNATGRHGAMVPWRASGFSLVELMVALAIGVIMLTGAVLVFANSRAMLDTNDRLARLQENARYALDLIEPDVRAAGFWGRGNETEFVGGRAGPADPVAFVVTDDCDINWSVDLDNPVFGSDNANPFAASCLAGAGTYQAGTDVLVVRHVSDTPVATAALEAGRLYVRADDTHAEIFTGTAEPAGFAPDAQNFNLISHAYFISATSDFLGNLPSLRRLTLADGGATPAVVNREIISGVEDLQVQYGIDTDGDGSVNSYVDASPGMDTTGILAVRLWLRLRAEGVERGFTDAATYTYADQTFDPVATPDPTDEGTRRLLISKTIGLRNRVVVAGS